MTAKLKPLIELVKAIGRRHFITKYAYFAWVFPFEAIELVVDLLLWFFFVQALGGAPSFEERYEVNPVHFLLTGIVISRFLNYNVSNVYVIVRMLYHSGYSTFQRLSLGDYLNLYDIKLHYWLIGHMIWDYLRMALIASLYLLIGSLGFGLRLSVSLETVTAALAIFALGLIATLGIGLISASIYLLVGVYRSAEPVQWSVRLLSKVISGTYFPVDALPRALQYASLALPHTHTLSCLRSVLMLGKGADPNSLLLLALQAALFPLAGVPLFKLGLRKHFERGTLI